MRPAPRVAVVGCGRIASAVHVRALRRSPNARLVAVADPSPAARARAAQIGRVPAVADALELVTSRDVDAVVVAAPPEAHAELAIAALEAGKHLYLEKPLAATVEDAEAIVEAGAGTDVVAAAGFNRRFHPLFARAREVVASGALGRVVAVQSVFCEPLAVEEMPAWRRRRESGGGVMLDLAVHHFDLIPWLVGAQVESADATLASERSEHDHASVRLELSSGAAVDSFFSYRAARSDVILLVGEEGTLRADRYAAALDLHVSRAALSAVRRRRVGTTVGLAEWRLRRVIRPADEPSYRHALAAWLGAVRGRPQSLPTLADGLRALELVCEAESGSLTHA